ncbi:hypothetical protein [Dyadobacter luticola]|uniref:DUF2807 domain-containing protein n=1 Tax=Dyadobacter luticola TaxID=1979387 RepID=A0A5R9KYN4_9BACT|nr:hypothetical protein [Dyadobacter luticola]TLV01281.1 hypothetical protein FEN17_17730 [Dyadobacter luticola]
MKLSNLILTGLYSVVLLVTVGSNLILKAEYDKLDKTDALVSYRKEVLPPFHYVKLGGNTFGVTQIQPGKSHELRVIADPKLMRWKVIGDTLKITYQRDWAVNDRRKEWELGATPTFYVIAPEILGISNDDAIIKVNGWKSKAMKITQHDGAVQFSDNHIENLHLDFTSDVVGKMDPNNTFEKADFKVGPKSSLHVEKNIFGSYEMNVDSSAHVSLPGTMLKSPGL